MTAWWEGPLAAFDTETTGQDPEEARLVSVHLDGWDMLVDAGVDIPEQATQIHGITTERAREFGVPLRDVLPMIHARLMTLADRGIPIVAFNAPYDFTVLDREFHRNDAEERPDYVLRIPAGLMVIDPYVLDKHVDQYRSGSRKLVAMCGTYKVALDDAHDAKADAQAAMEVARVIGKRFAESLPDDPYILHTQQVQWRWQQSKSLEQYLMRSDPSTSVDPHWPVKPYHLVRSEAGA